MNLKFIFQPILTSQDINKIFALILYNFLYNKYNSSKIKKLTEGIKRGHQNSQ